SSRRRHTRFSRDWSSDVCSSDLRMTQRDKWQKRPAVMRYRAFCDELRARNCTFPESDSHVIFHIPMPKSWSKKKRAEMLGQPHRSEEHTSELQSRENLVCRLLLE